MSLPAALHRGDIVIAAFPFTDLSSNKRRPAVVLAVRTGYPDVILAFISSVLPTVFETHDLPLLPSDRGFSQTGLKVPSVIRLNKLATIDKHLITRRIGKLTRHHLHIYTPQQHISIFFTQVKVLFYGAAQYNIR